MTEHQVREHVRKLRRFYTDALIYAIVNIGLILIWAISGGGYFWPIWVIIGWGIGLGVHAFSLGLIPQMNAMVPFMTAKWEDQEVRRLMEAGYKGKEHIEQKAQKKSEMQAAQTGTVTTEAVIISTPESKPKSKKTKGPTIKKPRVASPKKLKN